jgi:hypothetical protein
MVLQYPRGYCSHGGAVRVRGTGEADRRALPTAGKREGISF